MSLEKFEKDKFFRDLCTENYNCLYKYILKKVNNVYDSEDLTQQLFLRVYINIDEIYNHPNRLGWMYKAINFFEDDLFSYLEKFLKPLEVNILRYKYKFGYNNKEIAKISDNLINIKIHRIKIKVRNLYNKEKFLD